MLNTIIVMLLVVFIVVCAVVFGKYSAWKRITINNLENGSQIIDIESGQIEYKIYGSSGDTILYLHGSPGGYDQYVPGRNPYLNNYRVLSISRPGYLRTPLSTGQSLSEQADAIAALLNALGIETVIVMGASGGGPISLAFASYYPEKTTGMVLYAAASQAYDSAPKQAGTQFLQKVTRLDFASWLLMRPLIAKPEKMVRLLVNGEQNQQKILQNPEDAQLLANSLNSALPPSLRNPGIENDVKLLKTLDVPLDRITAPTIIYHGDQDLHVPFEQSQKLHQQLKHSRFVPLEGGDHFAHYTHQDIMAARTKEFLQGLHPVD